jgi:hypothetical protein
MDVATIEKEIQFLNIDNIRKFPCSTTLKEDFYSICNKMGVTAARQLLIAPLHNGEIPVPSEYFKKK